MANKQIMYFGKYKNQSIDKVFQDKNYYNWIMKQSFLKKNHHEVFLKLLNYKEKPKITFDDLPNDITELIFAKRYEIMKKEKQDKINKIIIRFPFVYRCSSCGKNYYNKFRECNYNANTSTCDNYCIHRTETYKKKNMFLKLNLFK